MQTSSVAAGSLSSLSPSFNAYSSSDRLAQIAARVVSEFRQELDDAGLEEIDYDVYDDNNNGQFSPPRLEQVTRVEQDVKHVDEEDDEEFEFAFVCTDGEAPTSPIAAEEVFYNGQIRPVYPVFDQSLLLQNDDVDSAVNKDSDKSSSSSSEEVTKPRRLPLRMLMIEEERVTASCSSSEADDLENLPPGTYCVWVPPKASGKGGGNGGGGGCDKSSSTGSSKRWKFRDFLSRSSSDGAKDTFVFFPPAPATTKTEKEGNNVVVARKVRSGKGVADGEKRRSYLPYRQDLVGFFSNVNGLSRNLHPF